MSGNGGDASTAAVAAASAVETMPSDQHAAPAAAAKPDEASEPSHAEKYPESSEKSAGEESASTSKDTAAVGGDAVKKVAETAGGDDATAKAGAAAPTAGTQSPGKKRGRKPKQDKENAETDANKRAKVSPTTPPKKRGRPPKKLVEERARAKAEADAASAAAGATAEPIVAGENDGEKKAAADGQQDGGGDKEERASAEKPKKRKSLTTSKKSKKSGDNDTSAAATALGEETESEPEKQPKKRAKTSSAKAAKDKKSPGRKKKPVVVEEEASDSEDEAQKEVVERVDALDPEVKAKFGQIVWAKMVGYPYWPALITDPRHLPPKFQVNAMKDLETKYLVYFYSSKNFASTLFKNIEPWDDTKNNYREGFPLKESKAPKRRAQLMEAIAEADKEFMLPVEERVDGLLKPIVKEPKAKKPTRDEATPEKRRGRPPGSKSKNKSSPKPAGERKSSKKKKKSSGEGGEDNQEESSKEDEGEEADEPSQESVEEEEEDPVTHSLSKEEIKAKIASRKTPSKKKVTADETDAKSKSGATKKQSGTATGKTGGKAASTSTSDDIDTKRKKEIELVVPRKSVKSADIREMAEEAAKKKLGGGGQQKEKTKKDKGDYKVGDLGAFASKLTRFHANESSKNNDEVIQMLNQLFEEKVVFRSDVERSGLAAIIALLRKSSNPTVAQTASALRKHLMKIIRMDTGTDGAPAVAETTSRSASKKQKDAKPARDKKDDSLAAKEEIAANGVTKSEAAADADKTVAVKSAEKKTKVDEASSDAASTATPVDAKVSTTDEPKGAVKTEDAAAKTEDDTSKSAPASTEVSKDSDDKSVVKTVDDASSEETSEVEAKKSDGSLDKNRQAFVDMLSNVLELSGATHLALAKEIEEFVFDRYKESNEDYMVQARKITFGLKGNKNLRDRLFSGSLHGLELVYADDKFFEASP